MILVDWDELAAREEARYADGARRLPADPDARQRQLVRMAMAAGGAGLARLMQGRDSEAAEWLERSADRYRESWEAAPPESWGRVVGAVKARVLAADAGGASADAEWALAQLPDDGVSAIGRYAGALAALVLGDDERAASLARSLTREPSEAFPAPVATALHALAARDAAAYAAAAREVLASFESRDAYLEDVPVADTVLVLERLADDRGLAAELESALLPPRRAARSRT